MKGYAAHEQGVFEEVTRARAQAIGATGVGAQAQAENMVTSALKSLFAVAEAYPDLKANENFLALQQELSATEERIAYARQFYNDTVQSWNTKIETLPTNLVAGLLNAEKREYFEADESGRGPVRVDF